MPARLTLTGGFDGVYGDEWTTLDLTGDARPDLVCRADDASAVWGATASPCWKVFKNQP